MKFQSPLKGDFFLCERAARPVHCDRQLGSGATHVALSNNIGSDFKHWCKVLAAKSVMGNTESILAPMAGEGAIVHERLVSVTSAGAGENQNEIIQSNPSPEFLNSLPFIKKFYPLPAGARAKFTKVTHDNSCNSRHSERQRKNPAYYCNTIKLKGIYMNNLTETVYSPLTTHNSLKKSAFTLAEVLITLGIIGVVAAITLPSLIQRNIEKQRVAQLKKAYSELSQAYNLAVEEFGAPTEWGMGGMYEEKSHYIMANNMRKFLKLSVDCVDMPDSEAKRVCGQEDKIGKLYIQNVIIQNTVKRYGRSVILSDGATVAFRAYNGQCNHQYGAAKNVCGDITVDVNGSSYPNQLGEDQFSFFFTKDKLVPAGIKGSSLTFERACNRLISSPYPSYDSANMYACAAWVLYNENQDYLHCDDLSWDGKHSCKE